MDNPLVILQLTGSEGESRHADSFCIVLYVVLCLVQVDWDTDYGHPMKA